jgi:threonine dehydrogenase-like Zn-dependent dehydrogenase
VTVETIVVPDPGPGEAKVRVQACGVCHTDLHYREGAINDDFPFLLGHEAAGTVEAIGAGVTNVAAGDFVVLNWRAVCGQCRACLSGDASQCGHGGEGYEAIGGWRFGNTIDGCQAEYVRVPNAMANLAPIPDGLTDEQVLMCPDIMSTGFGGAENGGIRVGDTVAVFAQGPIGLCATVGAKLRGASLIIAIDPNPQRLEIARRLGANVTINPADGDPLPEIRRLTGGRGVDVGSKLSGGRRHSRTPSAPSVRAARCRALECTRASSSRPIRRSTPALAIRRL